MRSKLARLSHTRQPRTWRDQSGRQWRDIDQTTPLLAAPDAAAWSALIVAPRMESDAARALREAGYLAWYPQTVETVTSQHRRTRTKVNRPLFPRYVFAAPAEAVDRHSWPDRRVCRQIAEMAVSGVRSGFSDGSVERVGMLDCDHVVRIVASVPQSLLTDLSRRQDGGEFVATLRESAYRRGARVLVVEGPFDGFDGVVHRATADRVEVLVGMLGQEVRVEMEAAQVRAA